MNVTSVSMNGIFEEWGHGLVFQVDKVKSQQSGTLPFLPVHKIIFCFFFNCLPGPFKPWVESVSKLGRSAREGCPELSPDLPSVEET